MKSPFEGSSPLPTSHNALVDFSYARFKAGLERGDYEPYVWPYRSFGIYVLLAYMLLPPTENKLVRYAKYPVFAFFTYWGVRTILETKSASAPLTYGIGLVDAWAIIWCSSFVIFRDLRDVRRVERKLVPKAPTGADDDDVPPSEAVTTTASTLGKEPATGETRARLIHTSDTPQTSLSNGKNDLFPPPKRPPPAYDYYWQSLPTPFLTRLEFIADLLFSMRGPGWSHQARCIPSPPPHISSQLSPPPPKAHPAPPSPSAPSTRSLLLTNLLHFILNYILLDLLKTYTTHDHYFLGRGSLVTSPFSAPYMTPPTSTPPLPSFVPSIIAHAPTLTKWLRLVITVLYVRTALSTVFTLSPLFFANPYLPFPFSASRLIGLRSEPWFYPPFESSPSPIWNHGLAGWWGTWWHQLFRVGFETPGLWLCSTLSLPPKSPRGRTLMVLTAFGLSALLHAAGSRTMLPPIPGATTRPFGGPGVFFGLQALGVITESVVTSWLKRQSCWEHTVPLGVKKVGTFAWVAGWMYWTAPLFVDDFTRGGIWLFEPVPWSAMAVLGLREEGDARGWRWKGRNVFLWRGDVWWRSGVAV